MIGKIALTDAGIAKYTWKLKPPRHGSSSSQARTNELEEFSLTFSQLTSTNISASKSNKDGWIVGGVIDRGLSARPPARILDEWALRANASWSRTDGEALYWSNSEFRR